MTKKSMFSYYALALTFIETHCWRSFLFLRVDTLRLEKNDGTEWENERVNERKKFEKKGKSFAEHLIESSNKDVWKHWKSEEREETRFNTKQKLNEFSEEKWKYLKGKKKKLNST